jgi:hypothetical protein
MSKIIAKTETPSEIVTAAPAKPLRRPRRARAGGTIEVGKRTSDDIRQAVERMKARIPLEPEPANDED